MIQALFASVARARQERLPQVAASLSFTTLLSLVPLLALSYAAFTRFPKGLAHIELALEQQLLSRLVPEGIARTVMHYLHQFAANAGSLTLASSALLLVTALAMLLTVENTFNQIWNVKRARPWARRLAIYCVVLVIGPPLLGLSLWATSYVIGASMGWSQSSLPSWVRAALDVAPLVLGWAGLSCLFYCLPHTRVRKRDALVGGLLASIALELGKQGFASYLLKLPTYKAVYGTFAVFPMFLLWIYFSWLVTLSVALFVAALGRGAK